MAFRVESMQRQLDETRQMHTGYHATMKNIEMMLVEAVGRSGKDGRLGHIEQRLADSATSQGQRIGALEVDLGKLKQTRAQLYVVAVVALSALGALFKILFSGGV